MKKRLLALEGGYGAVWGEQVDSVPKETSEMSWEDMLNQSQIDQGGGVG